MKRREAIKGGIGLLTLGVAGNTLGAQPCPPTLTGTSPVNCPKPVGPEGGAISALAESMSAGAWAELRTTSGLSNIVSRYLSGAYGAQNGGRGFFEYATNGIWIEDYSELHFRGSGHQSAGIHIRYLESTGEWEHLSSFPAWEHQYDHTAYDQRNNVMYATRPADRGIEKWAYADGPGNWRSAASRIGSIIIAEGIEYFPDTNGGAGGLIHYGGYAQDGSQTGGIRLSNPDVSSWSWVDDDFFPSSGERYHVNATYLHAHKVVLCGGGNSGSDSVQIDAAGKVTARNRLPAHWGAGDNNQMGTVLSDSGTGRIFFVSASGNSLYEHNFSADRWNRLGGLPSSGPRSFVTMISTYGVILLVEGGSTDTNPGIWLYKL
jgi:hypothetical protein